MTYHSMPDVESDEVVQVVSIKPFFQELKGRMKKHIALIARAPINAQTLPNWPQQFPTQHPRRQKIASNDTLF